jgi:hypothetical protein
MSRADWDDLLEAVRTAHANSPELQAFCDFPTDLQPQKVTPFHIPPAALMAAETGLFSDHHTALRDGFITCGPHAQWRETYKDTDIGQDFMDRFGCYNLIGQGGAFSSAQMWAWVVYMPPGLHYPWHHHPGEEIYLVLGGEAAFMRAGDATEMLRAGQVSQHGPNQPHAMETHDHPVMALVVWRNGFDTPPVLTPKDYIQ